MSTVFAYAGKRQATMKSWLLFGLLALLLGMGTWLVMGPNPSMQENASSSSTEGSPDLESHLASPEDALQPASADSELERKDLESLPADASLTRDRPALPFLGPAGHLRLEVVDGNGQPAAGSFVTFGLHTSLLEDAGIESLEIWEEGNRLEVGADGTLAVDVPLGLGMNLQIGGPLWREQSRLVDPLTSEEEVDLGRVVLTPANRVSGRVVDGDSQPVEGARVQLSETHGSSWDYVPSRTAQTDEDGRFSFDGVRSGRFRFDIFAQGFVLLRREAERVDSSRADQELEFVLDRGKSLRGRVTDEEGQAIAGAQIFTLSLEGDASWWGDWNPPLPQEEEPAAISDEAGQFLVYGLSDERASKLGARAEGYGDGYSQDPRSGEEAWIKLPRRFQVRGTVTRKGHPVADAQLRLQKFQDDGELTWGEYATSEEDGSFLFENVESGTFTLGGASTHGRIEDQEVQVQDDLLGQTVEVLDTHQLRLLVVDDHGDPLPGARVWLGYDYSSSEMFSSMGYINGNVFLSGSSFGDWANDGQEDASKTDSEGRVSFAGLAEGSQILNITAKGYARHSESIELSGEDQEMTVELFPGGALRVRVLDSSRKPVVGIEVALRDPNEEDSLRSHATDSAGRAIWDQLQPGHYQVSYQATDMGGWWWDEEDQETETDHHAVEIRAGKTHDLEMIVRDLALTTVRVTRNGRPAADVEVGMVEKQKSGSYWWSAGSGKLTDGYGEIQMAPVSAGEYHFFVKSGRSTPALEQDHTLHPGDQVIEFELQGGRIIGELTGKDGPLGAARVALVPYSDPSENAPDRHNMHISWGPNGVSIRDSNEERTNTRTDREGGYAFEDVPEGRWQVVVRSPGYGLWRSGPLTMQGSAEVDAGSQYMYPGAVVHGRDANHEAGQDSWSYWGHQVELWDEHGAQIGIGMPDDEGNYRIEDLPRGRFRVKRENFESEWIEVSEGGTYRVDIPLEEPEEEGSENTE